MTQKLQADVAIIGGGVIGLATGYELAALGQQVVIMERDVAGSGAGHFAAGMIAPASEADTADPALVELALQSCAMYPEWIKRVEADAGLEAGYRTEGSLLVALHRDHEEELERLAAFQNRIGLQTELVSREFILEKEPYLSPRVTRGFYFPADRQIDPRLLSATLAAAFRALGGTLIEGEDARPIMESGRPAGIESASGTYEVSAASVLVAGGTWSEQVWPLEAGALPLRPVKGQILRLHGQPVTNHIVRTPDIYLVPRHSGELVVGGTMEEQGFDTTPIAGAVMEMLREAWRVLPGTAELALAEVGVGLRPALRDNMPAIGASALDGLFVSTGHYRHGIMLAPISSTLLAEQIVSGTASESLRAFDPRRFEQVQSVAQEVR